MDELIDNKEINLILDVLEHMEDEELAASLLAEFNEATKHHGKLLMNKDPSLDHDDWKKKCDEASKEVELIVNRIHSYRS